MGPGRTPTVHTCSFRGGGRGWLTHETTIHNMVAEQRQIHEHPLTPLLNVRSRFAGCSCVRMMSAGDELNLKWQDGTVRFQCESGDEDRIAKHDKRIDVIMRYRLISNLTKTIEEKMIR